MKKRIEFQNPRSKTKFCFKPIPILIVFFALISLKMLQAITDSQWEIIDFIHHGTRRLVVVDDNRWFFYRPAVNDELTLQIPEGKIKIKVVVRQDVEDLSFQIRVGNTFRNFTASKVKSVDEFRVMENIYLNLGPGIHDVKISTSNRLAYFKVFREQEVWTVPTERKAITPDRFAREYNLVSDTSESPYFLATNIVPIEFTCIGPNEVLGFGRYFINDVEHIGEFDILKNNRIIDTITIPPRKTGSYQLEEDPEQELSIGRRIEFAVPAGEHRIRIVPRTDDKFIFRFIMDVPIIEVETEATVYSLNAFDELSLITTALTGLQLTFGTTLRYADNIFSLSDHDSNRFDRGDDRFHFIETADDVIANPSFRARYPFDLGDLTVEPYVNINYYHYLNNTEKSNFSILSALFNSYKQFNLNLYYGYYADTYVRDYFIRDEGDYIIDDQSFEYDRNLYRIYSYINLTDLDTPLFYYQIEEYYHNRYFTDYDGVATTFGIGWRRSFPTFYLRGFYYYRDFKGDNISDNNDPSYESNIYDFQFRNKRVELFNNYQFRPYIGFRFENRFFSREYTTAEAIGRFDYQSSRNDRRYRMNIGGEFYVTKNLDLFIEYEYFIRDSTSENPNVAKDKDYSQQSIYLGFEYTLNF